MRNDFYDYDELSKCCPASVSQGTPEELSGIKVSFHPFYGCDREIMRKMSREEAEAYRDELRKKRGTMMPIRRWISTLADSFVNLTSVISVRRIFCLRI